jgi:hypothetical protein
MAKRWIASAIEHKGALHRALGVPEGDKIPAKKMAKARNSENPRIKRMANLAKTLGSFHKAEGGRIHVEGEGEKSKHRADRSARRKD